MHTHCTDAVEPSRPAGSLVLSLALPIALALCLLARPYLGLLSPPQAGDRRGLQDEACGLTGLGRSIPAAPLARVDSVRIHCAWKVYRSLTHSRHRARASHSLSEGRQIRDTMIEYEDDYRCIYQEVTPEGRRRAHLPVPPLALDEEGPVPLFHAEIIARTRAGIRLSNREQHAMPSPTPARPRALLSWSSGKDAAWALHVLRLGGEVEVAGLLTTLNAEGDRIAMHAVRRTLLEAQARAAGLPVLTVPLPWPCTNAEYEAATGRALSEARERWGITHVAFGDLFLEDVRAYRERQLAGAGLTPLFPLWGLPTRALAREMIAGGLAARLTCVDPARLPASFAGRAFDAALLQDLPPDVDWCGEAGEFHTFAFAGPMFSHPIPLTVGEVVARDGFVFADLLLLKGDQTDAHRQTARDTADPT